MHRFIPTKRKQAAYMALLRSRVNLTYEKKLAIELTSCTPHFDRLPKGVMIAHKNLIAAMAGVTASVPGMGVGDYYVAYLPLAHILEMIAEAGECD
jgi:acyl-CoA synthetase (AMP-forming)/AMP-acid ligase II